MRNHPQQQQQKQVQDQETKVSMDSQLNPNLDTTINNHQHVLPSPSSSSQDLHHLQHIHISNKTHEDKGFIFKNANNNNNNNNNKNNNQVMVKNPSIISSSSTTTTLAAGEGYTIPPPPPPPPQHFKKTHHQHNIRVSKKINEKEGDFSTIKNNTNSLSSSSLAAAGEEAAVGEESGRDRLKRHRAEMAGRVRIPDIWGHEDLLKDWIDCTVFDSSLGNNSIMSARAALVQERRSTLRIQN